MKAEEEDNIIAVAYYWGEAFETPAGRGKMNFYKPRYNVGNYVDGILEEVWTVSKLKQYIQQRRKTTPPITIAMTSSCPGNSGEASIIIKNISSQSLSGTLHFSVKERHIDYSWADIKEVDCCNRGMLPDYNGEKITIAAGETVTKKRSFTLKPDWKKKNCRVLSFFQKADKEIVEGCRIHVNDNTAIAYKNISQPDAIKMIFKPKFFKIFSTFTGKYHLLFFDMQGRVLKQCIVDKTGQWVPVPLGLSSGIHCVKVKVHKREFIQRYNLIY